MALESRNKIKAEGGIASMTDLVFLLLIFFIIMSLMSNNQTPIDLPKPSEDLKSTQDPVPVQVIITEDNKYYVLPGETEKDAREFEAIKEKVMKEIAATEPKIRIAGHKGAKYEAVFNVLALAQANGWVPVLAFQK